MKLGKFLDSPEKKKRFAQELEVQISTVDRWINGARFPRKEHLEKILTFTKGKVTPSDFLEPSDSAVA